MILYCVSSQDIILPDNPLVEDSWMEVIGSQGESLLSLDVSSSTITDAGLTFLETCTNLETLALNFCDHISDVGLMSLSGITFIHWNSQFIVV